MTPEAWKLVLAIVGPTLTILGGLLIKIWFALRKEIRDGYQRQMDHEKEDAAKFADHEARIRHLEKVA